MDEWSTTQDFRNRILYFPPGSIDVWLKKFCLRERGDYFPAAEAGQALLLKLLFVHNYSQKPEAFKSNNPGYIRGEPGKNLSTPERVEDVTLRISLLKEYNADYIDYYLFASYSSTPPVL